MQSLMFLDCFVQKLSKKNFWGVSSTSAPHPLGKGKVKDPIFVGFENRNVWTHWKWPSSTRTVILEKDENRTCSIFTRHSSWHMKGADKLCMISPVIVLALNWRLHVSSENLIVWTHYKWPSDIFTTKTEPWNRTVCTPTSNFRNQESDLQNQIVWTGLSFI